MTVTRSSETVGRRPALDADAIAGLVVFGFGVFFAIASLNITTSPFANTVLEPRDLPLVVAAGLIVTGLALTVQSVVRARRAAQPRTEPAAATTTPPDDAGPPAPDGAAEDAAEPAADVRHILVYGALLLGYVVILIPVGYIASTFAFIMIGTWYYDRGHVVRNLAYALVFSFGVFAAFNYALGVVLPDGILGFMP